MSANGEFQVNALRDEVVKIIRRHVYAVIESDDLRHRERIGVERAGVEQAADAIGELLSAGEPCLYADVADGGCALRATIDSPPPTSVQIRESIYRIRDLEALVRDLTDADECWYDHHGYCQAHSLHERPCPHERAKQMVRHG